MNRTMIAIAVAVAGCAMVLAATYKIFFVMAASFPPGRVLGMFSAALMVGSGLLCAGIGYLANRWVGRGAD
jgi:hypothetical protein